MPNNPRAGGVSRRIEGEDRDQMRGARWTRSRSPTAWARSSAPPASAATEELQWDLDNLLQQWEAIEEAAQGRPPRS
jgi:ribonuclease E